MKTMTTLKNIEDAITALKDGWASTALNILEEARLNEMAISQLMKTGIYPPGTADAAPVQEPLGEVIGTNEYVGFGQIKQVKTIQWRGEPAPIGTKLYTTPPAAQRQWVGLTKTVVGNYLRRHALGDQSTFRKGFKEGMAFAEAKLKEKNT